MGRRGPQLDQVGAGHHTDDLPLTQHRDLADAVLGHHLLQPLYRVARRHVDVALGHKVARRLAVQLQPLGAVDLAAGEDAFDLPFCTDDGKALKAILEHGLRRLVDRGGGRERMHTVGHDLVDRRAGVDVPLQQLQEPAADRVQRLAPDQRRRCPGMAAAAQMAGHVAHVDGVGGGASHQLQMLAQVDDKKEPGRVVEVADVVGQGRYLFDITLGGGGGDDHRVPGKVDRLGATQQRIVEG